MKLAVIQSVYSRNEYIRESVIANTKALNESGIPYQYVIFNDKGDTQIKEDIQDILTDKIEYTYSETNYGMGIQSGGWIGAADFYTKSDYIHNIGEDDIFTAMFYKSLVNRLEASNVYLAYANGLKVGLDLSSMNETMGPLHEVDYSDPKKVFNAWFGRQGNILTKANNFIPAPGVIYKRSLHDIIGPPDIEQYKGSADFEYWTRLLFNGLGVSYDPRLLWLYRRSKYSLGSNPTFEKRSAEWNNLILKNYQQRVTLSI